MVGQRPSHNFMQAGLPDTVRSIALRPAFGTNGLGYSTTTTTMRWFLPTALRGGGLD